MKLFKRLKKSSSKYSALSGNMLLFAISSFGSKIVSFLLVPLYTSVLSAAEYGTVDLLTTTSTLLIPIATLNIQDAVLRFALDKNYTPSDVISTGFRINLVGAGVVFLGLMAAKISGLVRIDGTLLSFLYFMYLLGALNNMLTLYLKARDRISVLVVSGLLNTFLMCTFNILFLLEFKMRLDGYLWAYVLSNLAAVLYQLIFGRILGEVHLLSAKNISKDMITYSSPLIANSLAWWINNACGRYVLTLMCGVAANGLLSVAYKIPTILSTVQSIFYNAWSISAIKEFDPEDKDGFIGNIYGTYSSLSVIVCSGIMLLNIPLARILYANDFFSAWQYVPFILVGTVFNGLALFEGCLFTAVKRTKDVSKSTIVGAAVNIIGNVIFIYSMGTMGAALAAMCGYLATFIMRSWNLKDIIRMKINVRRMSIIYTLLIVQAIVSVLPKLYIYQIVLQFAIIWLEWDSMKEFIKKLLQ